MTDTDLLGPGSGDEVTPEPDDREALADALTDLAATHGDATGTLVPIDAARDAIIAAGFRRHPEPVKPSREDVARALRDSGVRCVYYCWEDSYDECADCQDACRQHADAVLALRPGRTEAEVQAETLREAAGLIDRYSANEASTWLRERADRIERGEA